MQQDFFTWFAQILVQGFHQRLLMGVDGIPQLAQPGPTLVGCGDKEVLTLKVKGVLQVFHGKVLSYKRNNARQVQSS